MENIRLCGKKYPDISLRANAIIGFPTETWSEVKKTIDFSLKMCDAHPNISMTFSIYTPYPGTKLYDLTIKNGFRPPKNLEGWGKYDLDIADGVMKACMGSIRDIRTSIDTYRSLLAWLKAELLRSE